MCKNNNEILIAKIYHKQDINKGKTSSCIGLAFTKI